MPQNLNATILFHGPRVASIHNIDEYERVPQYSPAIPIDMQFLRVFGGLSPKILRALDVPADTTRIQLFLTIKDAQITRKSSFLTFRPYIFR